MSGTFRPEQNTEVTATDDPDLARAHGLTQFNRQTGQWEAPTAPDAGQRDGTTVPGHEDYVDAYGDDSPEAREQAAREDDGRTADQLTDRERQAEHDEQHEDDEIEHDEQDDDEPVL